MIFAKKIRFAMNELACNLLVATVSSGISYFLSQMFKHDSLARENCSILLQELYDRLQLLDKQLSITSRLPNDDHKALIEIEKCISKLKNASFGLKIQNQALKSSLSSSNESFLRYHTRQDGLGTNLITLPSTYARFGALAFTLLLLLKSCSQFKSLCNYLSIKEGGLI